MTETDGVCVIVRAERGDGLTLADIASVKRRADAARQAQEQARERARERRTRDTRQAAQARQAAQENDALARLARQDGDTVLARLAAQGAACERATARNAARRADPNAARHVAAATRRYDARRDATRQDAQDVTRRNAERVTFWRNALQDAERMPQATRAERRTRRNAIHNATARLRSAER